MNKSHQKILDAVMKQINDGNVLPWARPWKRSTVNGKTIVGAMNIRGNGYRGINQFLLSFLPYESPVFLTFNQAKDLAIVKAKRDGTIEERFKDGSKIPDGYFDDPRTIKKKPIWWDLETDKPFRKGVMKGEKSHPAVFFKPTKYENSKGEEKNGVFLRTYAVFNVAQCEGLPADKLPQIEAPDEEFSPIEKAEEVIKGFKGRPTIEHIGQQAYYKPSCDLVALPPQDTFNTPAGYYTTAFHELGHSTGHRARLNRPEVVNGGMFDSCDYGKEELVAELTACFLCEHTGIEKTFDNSVAYLENWIKTIKSDPSILIQSAGKAQKAFDLITNQNQKEEVTA